MAEISTKKEGIYLDYIQTIIKTHLQAIQEMIVLSTMIIFQDREISHR